MRLRASRSLSNPSLGTLEPAILEIYDFDATGKDIKSDSRTFQEVGNLKQQLISFKLEIFHLFIIDIIEVMIFWNAEAIKLLLH